MPEPTELKKPESNRIEDYPVVKAEFEEVMLSVERVRQQLKSISSCIKELDAILGNKERMEKIGSVAIDEYRHWHNVVQDLIDIESGQVIQEVIDKVIKLKVHLEIAESPESLK